MASFGAYAKKNGIKYFLISFVDLFGTMRAKIVPATAIDTMAKAGAGFAGFAVWFDMTPAHADILVMADLDTAIQLPWKPEVAWVTGDLMMDGKPVTQNPRQVLKRVIADAAKRRLRHEDRRRVRIFHDPARRQRDLGRRRHAGEALLRPAGADAPLRDDHRDLRLHDRARLGAVPERPRGRERPVRDELGIRHRAEDRRQARVLQVHGQVDRREARPARDLHAEAVRQPHRQRLPRACVAVAEEQEPVRRSEGRARPLGARLQLHRRRDAFGRSA